MAILHGEWGEGGQEFSLPPSSVHSDGSSKTPIIQVSDLFFPLSTSLEQLSVCLTKQGWI